MGGMSVSSSFPFVFATDTTIREFHVISHQFIIIHVRNSYTDTRCCFDAAVGEEDVDRNRTDYYRIHIASVVLFASKLWCLCHLLSISDRF